MATARKFHMALDRGSPLARSLLLLSVLRLAAAECQCTRFHCKDSAGHDHVYSATGMLSLEAQWCVGNSTVYSPSGACAYCAGGCESGVCECKSSLSCAWYQWAAGAFCFALALVFVVLAVRSCWKWRRLMKAAKVRPDDLEEQIAQTLSPWERNPRIAICLPLALAVGLVGLGLAAFLSLSSFS